MANKLSVEASDRTLEIARPFDYPRELVFQAYSDGEGIKNWFGPEGWPVTESKMDFRPGGSWHFCMTGPDGEQSWSIVRYREIEAPERIVYRDAFSDTEGNVNPPESDVTVTFEERGPNSTMLHINIVFESNEDRDEVIAMGMEEGLGMTLDNLEAYLGQQR